MIKGIRKEVYACEAYVAGRSMDEVMEVYGLKQVIKLSSNENPYAPYEISKEAMLSEIPKINVYPEKNYKRLKKLLGEKFGVGTDYISLGHGAGNVLEEIAKTFLEEEDEVIVPKQTYRLYREISKIMGAKVVELSLDDTYSINLEDFKAALTTKTKLIWICNPNNPTGTIIPKKNFDYFVEALPEHTWMVIDEAYAEFMAPEERPDFIKYIKNKKNVIIVRTFSKYYGLAGARIGYVIADPEVITLYDAVSEPFNANRIALAGAVALIEHEDNTCQKYGDILIQDREMIYLALQAMGLNPIRSSGNFIFFSTPYPAAKVSELLLYRGILARPCNGWGYDHHLRVTVGTTEQNKVFLTELRSVLEFLSKQL
jgi:histidinol-phosphate aminotransferase